MNHGYKIHTLYTYALKKLFVIERQGNDEKGPKNQIYKSSWEKELEKKLFQYWGRIFPLFK